MQEQDRNTMKNGVVITVYVESLTTRSRELSKDAIIKKAKPHPHFRMPQAAGTQGYDRRAQLLAYSRQLRNAAGSEKVQFLSNQSQPRSKKRLWLAQPVRICSPSTQMPPSSSNRCRHEHMEPKVSKEISRSKKRNGSGNNCYTFLRKLKNMLKVLSCKEIKW